MRNIKTENLHNDFAKYFINTCFFIKFLIIYKIIKKKVGNIYETNSRKRKSWKVS